MLTVGYWSIRGLAAPLRMMVMYNNIPLVCHNYECVENETKDGYDRSDWYNVKPQFQEKNPLMNLPYVIDGDLIVTQSNACLQYLGRKFDMIGSNPKEQIDCDQLLCECTDLRNSVVGIGYSSLKNIRAWLDSMEAKDSNLDKLNKWLVRKYPDLSAISESDALFFVGEKPTAPDFHIWEMCDQISLMSQYYNEPSPFLLFAHLAKFHDRFAQLPNNQRYLKSKLAQLPTNNIRAQTFGATPSGDAWVWGSEKYWKGSSGTY